MFYTTKWKGNHGKGKDQVGLEFTKVFKYVDFAYNLHIQYCFWTKESMHIYIYVGQCEQKHSMKF